MQQQLLFPADLPYQVDSPELSEIRERVTAHPAACSRRELLAALGVRNPEQLDGIDLQFAQPLELGAAGASAREIASLVATTELARRMALAQVPDREPLLHPSAVARFLLLNFGVSDQEVMGALYLDVRHRLLQAKELFRGTLNRASVEPRALLKHGLLAGAAGLMLFHTHPSGDPSPSAEDLVFTRRLADAGELVGVRLVDHIVIGNTGAWVSLRERGGW